jgi:hypothetical protein
MGFADDGVRRVNGCQSDRLAVLSYKRECREYFIRTGGRLGRGRPAFGFPRLQRERRPIPNAQAFAAPLTRECVRKGIELG